MALLDQYRVVVTSKLQNQTIQNVLHYIVSVNDTDSNIMAILEGFMESTWITGATNFLSTAVTFTNIAINRYFPGIPTATQDFPQGAIGTVTGSCMPAEVAAVFSKKTIYSGPKYRGRIYMAGIPVSAMVQATGLWQGSLNGDSADFQGALILTVSNSLVGPGTLKPIIAHRAIGTYEAITAASLNPAPRSQRRRQIGRGI